MQVKLLPFRKNDRCSCAGGPCRRCYLLFLLHGNASIGKLTEGKEWCYKGPCLRGHWTSSSPSSIMQQWVETKTRKLGTVEVHAESNSAESLHRRADSWYEALTPATCGAFFGAATCRNTESLVTMMIIHRLVCLLQHEMSGVLQICN